MTSNTNALSEVKGDRPLVSIITPVYNGSKYLEDLIKTVLEQDYPRIEHIIIDDGSNDNGATVNILKRYSHLRWWSHPNKGAYATINEGLLASKGDVVTVICSDDRYACPTAISAAVRALITRAADVVYGDTQRIDERGRRVDAEPPRSAPLWLFRYYPGITHCSLLLWRRIVAGDGLMFDEALPYAADHDWILRLIKSKYRFTRINQPIAQFRHHAHQRSYDANPVRIKERELLIRYHGKPNPVMVVIVSIWCRMVKLLHLLDRRGLWAALRVVFAKIGRLRGVPGSSISGSQCGG